ncbi:flippase [uncultured Algibacter sp.]|uniref:flippase n=1 Tax=uncultured Algibacter sp. TaxID=298659 RepID=UPI00262CE23B|nr:flippase [uncultured Algibacter sp.]
MFEKLKLLDKHTLEVFQKSGASMIVKLLGMVFSFLLSVFLGRKLGAEGLGIINLSNQIVQVLLIVSLLGVSQLLLKKVAIAYQKNDWKAISNYTHSSYWLVGKASVILFILFFTLAPHLSENIFNESKLKIPFIIFLIALIPQAFTNLFSFSLVGLKKIWQSNLTNEVLSIVLTTLGVLTLALLNVNITIINVALCYMVSRIIAFLTSGLYWNKLAFKVTDKKEKIPNLLKKASPFFLVNATGVISSNVDLLMLGLLTDIRSVGLYAVASRLAFLTSFFLQITNSAISPKLASMFAENKIEDINKMTQRVTLVLIIIGITSTLFFFSFGRFLLEFWGEEFMEGYWVLVILSIGQFFNIGTGCSGYLLIMCGYEREHAYISIFTVILNVILNYLLINYFGMIGAAIATAIVVTSSNISKVVLSKRKTKISTIFKF